MSLNRREFVVHMAGALGVPAAGLVASMASVSHVRPGATRVSTGAPIRAILFDAFPVFDPRSVETVVETELPGRGATLTARASSLRGLRWLGRSRRVTLRLPDVLGESLEGAS